MHRTPYSIHHTPCTVHGTPYTIFLSSCCRLLYGTVTRKTFRSEGALQPRHVPWGVRGTRISARLLPSSLRPAANHGGGRRECRRASHSRWQRSRGFFALLPGTWYKENKRSFNPITHYIYIQNSSSYLLRSRFVNNLGQ